MSVPKGCRTESKLQVLVELQALATYTIQVCKNEKNFPKRDRWILTQHIVKLAVDAYALARKANAVRVVTMEDYKLRRGWQVECRSSLEALLGLIEIAYLALPLESERVEALGLTLNGKTQIFPLRHGIVFLKWHFYLTDSGRVVRKISRRSATKERRKLKKLTAMISDGRIPAEYLWMSYQSWRANAQRGNARETVRRMETLYNNLRREIDENGRNQGDTGGAAREGDREG